MSNDNKNTSSGPARDLYKQNKKEIVENVIAYTVATAGIGTLAVCWPGAITAFGAVLCGIASASSWHELWSLRKNNGSAPV